MISLEEALRRYNDDQGDSREGAREVINAAGKERLCDVGIHRVALRCVISDVYSRGWLEEKSNDALAIAVSAKLHALVSLV